MPWPTPRRLNPARSAPDLYAVIYALAERHNPQLAAWMDARRDELLQVIEIAMAEQRRKRAEEAPVALPQKYAELMTSFPRKKEERAAFFARLRALPRAELDALPLDGAGSFNPQWRREVRALKERYDGALRWVRKDHVERLEGRGNVTIGTRVRTMAQRQRSGASQGPVAAGTGVVVSSGTSDRHGAKKAVGTTAALQIRFDPEIPPEPASVVEPAPDAPRRASAIPGLTWTVTHTDRDGKMTERTGTFPRLSPFSRIAIFDDRRNRGGRYEIHYRDREGRIEPGPPAAAFKNLDEVAAFLADHKALNESPLEAQMPAREVEIVDTEAPRLQELIPRGTIDSIVGTRNQAIREAELAVRDLDKGYTHAREAYRLINAMVGSTAGTLHSYYDSNKEGLPTGKDYKPDVALEHFRRACDAKVWKYLLEMTQMVNLMDAKAKEDLRADLDSNPPAVTVEAVQQILQDLLNDAGLIFQRGLARAFAQLDPRFKSHDAFKLGDRVILTRLFNEWGSMQYGGPQDTLVDVERVFEVLDGNKEPNPRALIDRIKESRGGGFNARQGYVETDYFRIRSFKNGNAHLWFTRDDLVQKANELLADYYGEVLPDAAPANADARDLRSKSGALSKDLAFYPTPPAVVQELMKKLENGAWGGLEGKTVLEPSAGNGNIVEALAKAGMRVTAIEVEPGRYSQLAALGRRLGVKTLNQNFLKVTPQPVFDYVVMNPPFYGTHWMAHIRHAFDFLAPGGRLYAILPATAEVGQSKKHKVFRKWAAEYGRTRWGEKAIDWTDLPQESFASVGTRVQTGILELTKPGR